jgi:flagellar hook-length control protein FliK
MKGGDDMDEIMQNVDVIAATLPKIDKLKTKFLSKDFKLILDKLSKDMETETQDDINPLLVLVFKLNSAVSINEDEDSLTGLSADIENNEINAKQLNILLNSILQPGIQETTDDKILPDDGNTDGVELEKGNQGFGAFTDKDASVLQNKLYLLAELTNSDNTIKLSAEEPVITNDKLKSFLADTLKKADSAQIDKLNKTELNDQIGQADLNKMDDSAQSGQKKDSVGLTESLLDKIGVKEQDMLKEIKDFKLMEPSKSETIDKNNFNISGSTFKVPDELITDDDSGRATVNQPEINTEYILKQIAEGAKLSLTDKSKGEMVIDLKPPNLGKISMQVLVDKSTVTAKITTQNTDIKDIIEANINQLKDSLSQQGIRVDSLMVSVDNGGLFENGHRQNHGRYRHFVFSNMDKSYEDYEFSSYVDKDHVDCIV